MHRPACSSYPFRSVGILTSEYACTHNRFQIPAGEIIDKLFMHERSVVRWRDWFKEWSHVRTIAFICKDTCWRRSANKTVSETTTATENVVRQWLVDSSLQRFEMWSGVSAIQLSPQFRIAHARFHAFDKHEFSCRRYLFERDEMTSIWALQPPIKPLRSAISHFSEAICTRSCWICRVVDGAENLEDLECMISCWQDISEEDWYDRFAALMPQWSILDASRTYKLSI